MRRTEARYKNLHHYSWTLIHHQVIRLFLGTFSFTWNGHVPYLCKPPRIEWHSGSARRLRERRREISEITLISRYRKQTVHVIHYHYKQPIETHTSVHDDGKLVSFFTYIMLVMEKGHKMLAAFPGGQEGRLPPTDYFLISHVDSANKEDKEGRKTMRSVTCHTQYLLSRRYINRVMEMVLFDRFTFGASDVM